MIFHDLFEEKRNLIAPEINNLFDIAWRNQAHNGDLLLLYINGFYDESILAANSRLDPHQFGPGKEGLSAEAHNSFISKYIKSVIMDSYPIYLELFHSEKDNTEEINNFIENEEGLIQIEMLIYLKIWEADIIIKRLYQFARALNGEPYDWYFRLPQSDRDKNYTGKRHEIIRKHFRDKIENYSLPLYKTIKNTYKTQIRNSIAHSKYSFLGRNIHFNNDVKDDPHAQMKCLTFDDWIHVFHNTLVLHNEYIRLCNLINQYYQEIANKHNNTIEILVTDKNKEKYPCYVEYNHEFAYWDFKRKN